jgi:hypothetical protein
VRDPARLSFFEAVRGGDLAAVRTALADEPALAGARDEQGISAVLVACYHRQAAVRDALLAAGRAPDVLEAAARRAVDAWAEAVDGDDAALEGVAAPGAVRELLYPYGGNSRLVVRGPRLRALRITGLHADATPPAMTVEADLRGRRYLEDRDTAAVLGGSKEREVAFTERWTMALDGDDDTPWRIAEARAPARS